MSVGSIPHCSVKFNEVIDIRTIKKIKLYEGYINKVFNAYTRTFGT